MPPSSFTDLRDIDDNGATSTAHGDMDGVESPSPSDGDGQRNPSAAIVRYDDPSLQSSLEVTTKLNVMQSTLLEMKQKNEHLELLLSNVLDELRGLKREREPFHQQMANVGGLRDLPLDSKGMPAVAMFSLKGRACEIIQCNDVLTSIVSSDEKELTQRWHMCDALSAQILSQSAQVFWTKWKTKRWHLIRNTSLCADEMARVRVFAFFHVVFDETGAPVAHVLTAYPTNRKSWHS